MNHTETIVLWHKFIEGDDDALSKLYNFYVHDLYSYGLKIHGDEHLVKDCIQEVFIQLIAKRKTIKPTDSTHIYLFKSLRNKLVEELRSRNRRTDIVNSIANREDIHDISIEQSKVYTEEKENLSLKMAQALDMLSDYQMEAIYLKYSQGFEYEKIAEMLDIDVSSARTLIYRSLKKMKESLFNKAQIILFLFRSSHK